MTKICLFTHLEIKTKGENVFFFLKTFVVHEILWLHNNIHLNPDIAPPLLSTHANLRIEIPSFLYSITVYCSPQYTTTNYGKQTVVLCWGLTVLLLVDTVTSELLTVKKKGCRRVFVVCFSMHYSLPKL